MVTIALHMRYVPSQTLTPPYGSDRLPMVAIAILWLDRIPDFLDLSNPIDHFVIISQTHLSRPKND